MSAIVRVTYADGRRNDSISQQFVLVSVAFGRQPRRHGVTATQLEVAIIGAGMSGLCMAAKLQDAGIDTYTIFETADEVGGTGATTRTPDCPVTSRRASTRTRFGPNLDSSHSDPPGPEIQAYFQQVATNVASVRTSGSAPR